MIDDALANLVREAVRSELERWCPPAPAAASEPPRLLTVDGAATVLSVSAPTVRRLVDRGELPCVRVLGALRISRADIETFIERAKGGAE